MSKGPRGVVEERSFPPSSLCGTVSLYSSWDLSSQTRSWTWALSSENPLDRQGISDVVFTVADGPGDQGELWVDSCPTGGWLEPDGFPRDNWADENAQYIGKKHRSQVWHGWDCQCVACILGCFSLIWSLVTENKDTWYCTDLCSKQNSLPIFFSFTSGDLEDR